MSLIKIADSSIEFVCAANDTITRAALRAGLGMPYECNVGSCGTCKVELVNGAVESAWAEFVPFLAFDREIRTIICTTNAIVRLSCHECGWGAV